MKKGVIGDEGRMCHGALKICCHRLLLERDRPLNRPCEAPTALNRCDDDLNSNSMGKPNFLDIGRPETNWPPPS